MELIFATGNPGKAREIQQICDILGEKYDVNLIVRPMPDKVDIPETGSTYEENAAIKAEYVWKRYGVNAIADDSGLEVEALEGAPGLYTARYCNHDFKFGIDKMLNELEALGADDDMSRRASFECCLCVILDGEKHWFRGSCYGVIAKQRHGDGGFGFDPIFMPDEAPGQCNAELTDLQKNTISHRAIAMEKLFAFLSERQKKI